MATFGFLIVLVITILSTNSKNGSKATEDTLQFERSDSIIIFIDLLCSFIIDNITTHFIKNSGFIIHFLLCIMLYL